MKSDPPIAGALTEEAVRQALRQVIDPEVGMNIVDLGLVYGIRIGEGALQVDLTMTSPACPMGDMVVDEAREALEGLVPAGTEVTVDLVWEPPWEPSRMSDSAKGHFGWE